MSFDPVPARILAIVLVSVPVTILDISSRRIPNCLVLVVLVAGFLLRLPGQPGAWWEPGMSIATGLLVPLIARVATGGGLGAGDVKLAGALGLYTTWPHVLVALAVSAVLALGAIATGWAEDRLGPLLGRVHPNARQIGYGIEAGIPFGPFLIGGTLVVMMGELW